MHGTSNLLLYYIFLVITLETPLFWWGWFLISGIAGSGGTSISHLRVYACKHKTHTENIHIYIHIDIIYKHLRIYIIGDRKKSLINSSAVSASLWNTLKWVPKIVFNNELLRVHSLSCFFTRTSKSGPKLPWQYV